MTAIIISNGELSRVYLGTTQQQLHQDGRMWHDSHGPWFDGRLRIPRYMYRGTKLEISGKVPFIPHRKVVWGTRDQSPHS